MTTRDELEMLRRLAEIEARRAQPAAPAASAAAPAAAPTPAQEQPGLLAQVASSVLSSPRGVRSLPLVSRILERPQERFNIADPRQWVGAGQAAAGGAMDTWLGIQQRAAEASGDKAKQEQLQEQAEQRRAQEHAQLSTVPGATAEARAIGRGAPFAPLAFVPGMQGIAGAGIIGAASGLAEPTVGKESPWLNAAKGGVMSMVLPLGARAYGLYSRYLTPEGAQRRAAEDMVRHLVPDDAPPQARAQAIVEATNQLRQFFGASTTAQVNALQGRQGGGIPLTVAARTRNDALARAEQASRLRSPEMWVDFDRQQQQALAASVLAATRESGQLAARQGARSSAYQTGRDAAVANVDPAAFAVARQQLRANLDTAMRSPEAINPDVMSMLRSLAKQMDDLGPDFGPRHLMEVRSGLSGKAMPMASTNPFKTAPRDSPATISLKTEVDNILDSTSGGMWSPVVQGYRQGSEGVRQSQAARAVRDVFYDPDTGLARRMAAGDLTGTTPQITQAGLATAIEKTRQGGRSQLSPDARTGLAETMRALRAQQQIQQMNRTATAGGGSASVPNLTALAQDKATDAALGAIPGMTGAAVRGGVGLIDQLVNARSNQATAQALQDPAALSRLLQQGAPMSSPEEAFLRLLRGGLAGSMAGW
jgi:hypothetical protein